MEGQWTYKREAVGAARPAELGMKRQTGTWWGLFVKGCDNMVARAQGSVTDWEVLWQRWPGTLLWHPPPATSCSEGQWSPAGGSLHPQDKVRTGQPDPVASQAGSHYGKLRGQGNQRPLTRTQGCHFQVTRQVQEFSTWEQGRQPLLKTMFGNYKVNSI